MSTAAVLQVQELCDQIVDHLHDSPRDLRNCVLVSSIFVRSAQYHLFHDIILNPKCSAIDNPHFDRNFREEAVCARLCDILVGSPHLVPPVRRLRARLSEDVCTPLYRVQFGNLEELVLHGHNQNPGQDCISQAAALISLPSVLRVGLISVDLPASHAARLFKSCSPQLKSLWLNGCTFPILGDTAPSDTGRRHTIHRFANEYSSFDPAWLLPLDFSKLVDLDLLMDSRAAFRGVLPQLTTQTLLHTARLTIRRLALPVAVYHPRTSTLPLPACFPALECLILSATWSSEEYFANLSAIFALLLNDPETRRHLATIQLEFRISGRHPISLAERLLPKVSDALALQPLPSLRRLAIHVEQSWLGLPITSRKIRERADEVGRVLQSAFAGFRERGVLSIQITDRWRQQISE